MVLWLSPNSSRRTSGQTVAIGCSVLIYPISPFPSSLLFSFLSPLPSPLFSFPLLFSLIYETSQNAPDAGAVITIKHNGIYESGTPFRSSLPPSLPSSPSAYVSLYHLLLSPKSARRSDCEDGIRDRRDKILLFLSFSSLLASLLTTDNMRQPYFVRVRPT